MIHVFPLNVYRAAWGYSLGILFIQTLKDSGLKTQDQKVSIPRSGFCSFRLGMSGQKKWWQQGFQSLVRDSAHSDLVLPSNSFIFIPVSIPRSGFCSFRLYEPGEIMSVVLSFNPSFGILLIQTFRRILCCAPESAFQSLVRDSAHSDGYRVALVLRAIPVSIPRSGFCSFRPISTGSTGTSSKMFQSLVRDSAHSDQLLNPVRITEPSVSIPRSGFCSFRLGK